MSTNAIDAPNLTDSQNSSKLLDQYGCGPIGFVGTDSGLYERHLLFDDSIAFGEQIVSKLIRAPGNDELIGRTKVTAANGWFAARPSGTENVYKIYAESFHSEAHLNSILSEAQEIVDGALRSSER
jgi:phosphoglucomutase